MAAVCASAPDGADEQSTLDRPFALAERKSIDRSNGSRMNDRNASQHDRLAGLLNSFLAAQPDEMRRMLDANAKALLDPRAEALLRQEAKRRATAGDQVVSRNLVWYA